LGEPEKKSHEADVNVDLWDWPSRNYSVEMNPDGTLFSIQIVDPLGSSQGVPSIHDVESFIAGVHALERGQEQPLLDQLSGDVSCYDGRDSTLHTGPVRELLSDKGNPLVRCLSQAAVAIRSTATSSGASFDLRMYEKAPPAMVAKFPKTCKLREIVFRWEVGAWRVYEVTMR
jgi:hypothetical protein